MHCAKKNEQIDVQLDTFLQNRLANYNVTLC